MKKKCRHCKARSGCRPKGLCWRCYYTPEITALYHSTSKFAVQGVGHKGTWAEPEPTAALGSGDQDARAAKVDVMHERAKAGVSLFSKRDARRDLT